MVKEKPLSPWRIQLHEIIFEADTPAGKAFDVTLLVAILASVVAVALETVESIENFMGTTLFVFEWVFTIFFTIEYILRLLCVRKPWKYALSFFGIVDLLSIIPTYLSLIFVGTHYFLVIRALRLLRVFRIFKLAHFFNEGTVLVNALKASRAKITVFLTFVLLLVTIIGAVMYFIEGGQDSGFTSIPRSIYWAIVTLTTVGYGDIAPSSPVGQFLAAFVMLLGYAVLAVPTGIVTAELTSSKMTEDITTRSCPSCTTEGHDLDAIYCKYCGETMENE